MAAPLQNTNFRRQFTAQFISMTGSTISPVAVTFGVLQVSDSPGQVGWVLAAYSIPMLLLMPFGGVWADRLPRHWLMGTADLVRFVTQFVFGALLIADSAPLWAMMALQAVTGAAQAFAMPAQLGVTVATAPPELRQQANALLALARDVTGIAGPLIAGTLTVTAGAGWALIIDGLSFLASAALLVTIKLPRLQRDRQSVLTEIRDGWREVIRRDWLWTTILYFGVFNLVFAAFAVLGPIQLSNQHHGALAWAIVMASLSVGTLFGNVLALRITPHYLLRWSRILELLVVPTIIALAFQAPLPVLIACALIMGVVMTYPDALWFTALQQEIPEDSISRVSSFDHLGSAVLQPVGYSFAAVLVTVGAFESLVLLAIIFTFATLATLAVPGVRNLSRTPSEADGAEAQSAL
jgi:predicted MFS family arabinose efflux permease